MILAHKAIDDGPHGGRASVEITILDGALGVYPKDAVAIGVELDNPRPSCAPCSRAWSERTGIRPARVLAERITLIRDLVSRRYVAVVHCHGDSMILHFGEDPPTNAAIASRLAFSESHAWLVKK